jgi:hypothetical protein
MGAQGSAIVDFGATYTDIAKKVITGQAGILGTSLVEAWIDATIAATADHSPDEHLVCDLDVFCQTIVAGTGFTIVLWARGTSLSYGKWNVSWVWN